MKREKSLALIRNTVFTAVFAFMLAAFLVASADAQQPPRQRCLEVSKSEYDMARKQKLLRNRFGDYVRTGRMLRRHYWYCT